MKNQTAKTRTENEQDGTQEPNQYQIQNFVAALLPWFREAKRDLPWRQNRTGYRVWISEIMLQQTRVQTVIPYYLDWMEKWPELRALAQAEEQEVLKAWEGLGYYSRARNILKAAKQLAAEGATDLPTRYKDLRALPGIGDYTAAAIASLVSGEKVAAVDGNVLRVMARYLANPWIRGNAKDLKSCRTLLNSWYENAAAHPGELNEALIEFGAIQCTPRNPQCQSCPLRTTCAALAQGKSQDYPLPPAAAKRQTEHYTVLVLRNTENDEVAVQQRPASGLLASLWEFPLLDGPRDTQEVHNYLDDLGYTVQASWEEKPIRHVFSHLIWELSVVCADVSATASDDWVWLPAKAADQLPFSAALVPLRERLWHGKI